MIAVDLATGKLKWWQQLIQNDQWEYDVAQPPVVYDGKVGGKTHRIVSVATKEGMWYAFDAVTGKAFHDRVKVLDRVEHPPLKAGQPVVVYPGLDRRPQLLAGGLRPEAELHLQRRGRDGRRPDPEEADADAEEAQVPARRHLPRARQRQLRRLPARAGRITARSARSTSRPGKRVWKFDTPEPERGGVSLTATGARLRRWRRRRAPRVRLEDRQGAVDVPDRTPDRRRADDLHRPAARSTSRSRSAARRPRRMAASRRSCRCSRSAAARPSPGSRRGSRRCSRLPRRRRRRR